MFGWLLRLFSNGFLFFILHLSQPGSFAPPLSAAREREALAKMHAGDGKARSELIEHNLRLVAHIVKKYYSAYSEQDDVGSLLDYAGNKIYSIAQGRDDRSFISIEKVLLQVYEHLHQLQTDPEASQGTKTGFSDLDEVLHMRDDLFTVIAGAIKNQVRRLKEEKMSTKASVLYLNILNETKTMVLQARNLIKSQGYFLSALKESDNKYTDVN